MFILGIFVFACGVCYALVMRGVSPTVLLAPTTIVLHLFAIVGVLTATQSFRVFWGGLKAALFPKLPLEEDLRGRAASLFRLLSKTAALVSVLGLIIGLFAVFGHLGDVERMGHALASALVSVAWGLLLISAFFEPLVFYLKKRQKE